jgi:hypothetical protein
LRPEPHTRWSHPNTTNRGACVPTRQLEEARRVV